jgi:hypothetical protein
MTAFSEPVAEPEESKKRTSSEACSEQSSFDLENDTIQLDEPVATLANAPRKDSVELLTSAADTKHAQIRSEEAKDESKRPIAEASKFGFGDEIVMTVLIYFRMVRKVPGNIVSGMHSFIPASKPVVVEKVFIHHIFPSKLTSSQKVAPVVKSLQIAKELREKEERERYVTGLFATNRSHF